MPWSLLCLFYPSMNRYQIHAQKSEHVPLYWVMTINDLWVFLSNSFDLYLTWDHHFYKKLPNAWVKPTHRLPMWNQYFTRNSPIHAQLDNDFRILRREYVSKKKPLKALQDCQIHRRRHSLVIVRCHTYGELKTNKHYNCRFAALEPLCQLMVNVIKYSLSQSHSRVNNFPDMCTDPH